MDSTIMNRHIMRKRKNNEFLPPRLNVILYDVHGLVHETFQTPPGLNLHRYLAEIHRGCIITSNVGDSHKLYIRDKGENVIYTVVVSVVN